MKKALLFLPFVILLHGCAQKRKPAQLSATSTESHNDARRIELLFLGHDSRHHFSEKYFPMLSLPLFQKGINLTYTSDPNALNTENLAQYDGVVIYANHNVYKNEGAPEEVTAIQTFYESQYLEQNKPITYIQFKIK